MRPLVLLVASLAVAGCSATPPGAGSYDATAGLTRYRSAPIPLGRSAQAGYASNTALVLRAEAECSGEGCPPDQYTVSVVNTGSNEIAADFNQVVFTTPQGTISFDPGRQSESSSSPVAFFSSGRGELIRISLPADIFASFATANTLSVRLGASEYTIPYESRSSLRRMIPGA